MTCEKHSRVEESIQTKICFASPFFLQTFFFPIISQRVVSCERRRILLDTPSILNRLTALFVTALLVKIPYFLFFFFYLRLQHAAPPAAMHTIERHSCGVCAKDEFAIRGSIKSRADVRLLLLLLCTSSPFWWKNRTFAPNCRSGLLLTACRTFLIVIPRVHSLCCTIAAYLQLDQTFLSLRLPARPRRVSKWETKTYSLRVMDAYPRHCLLNCVSLHK